MTTTEPVRRLRRTIRWYPLSTAYLCVMVTVIVLLLLFGSPIHCNCAIR